MDLRSPRWGDPRSSRGRSGAALRELRCGRSILAGEAGAGAGSGDGLGEATSRSKAEPTEPSRRSTLRVACTLVLALTAGASSAATQSPEADVVAVIDSYHTALASGDSTAALALLADDVPILESGGVENKEHDRRSG